MPSSTTSSTSTTSTLINEHSAIFPSGPIQPHDGTAQAIPTTRELAIVNDLFNSPPSSPRSNDRRHALPRFTLSINGHKFIRPWENVPGYCCPALITNPHSTPPSCRLERHFDQYLSSMHPLLEAVQCLIPYLTTTGRNLLLALLCQGYYFDICTPFTHTTAIFLAALCPMNYVNMWRDSTEPINFTIALSAVPLAHLAETSLFTLLLFLDSKTEFPNLQTQLEIQGQLIPYLQVLRGLISVTPVTAIYGWITSLVHNIPMESIFPQIGPVPLAIGVDNIVHRLVEILTTQPEIIKETQ